MRLFSRQRTLPVPAPAAAGTVTPDDPEIPRYPPFVRGLPVAPPERIVATQAELIGRLQDGLAFSDARFTALVRPVIERYAAFVHLLPASEAHHHRGAGGLFRHGLEVAFHAAQASQGRIFALDRSPAERRALEPRWRLAAGLAGLCHDLGKPVADLAVWDREGRTSWRPLLEPLTGWAAANGVDRYFLRWRERRHARHETFGLLVLERVLTPEVTAWLVDPDPEVMQGLLAAVAGIDDGAVLGPLVTEADQASVERDLRENHMDPAAVSLGVPVDRYLLDAMRRLVRGGRWQINVPGARLWMLAEGLHVAWPAGAEDVVQLLAADKVPGIPRDPDTLADILLERGLAIPRQEGSQTQRYWRLAPAALARDGQVVTLSMLRLASPELVLPGAAPAAVALVAACGPATSQVSAEQPADPPAGETGKEVAGAMGQGASVSDPALAPPRLGAQRPAAQETLCAPSTQPPVPAPGAQVPPKADHPLAGQGGDREHQERVRQATAWLSARGAGGTVLLGLAGRLSADPGEWDQRLRRQGAQLVVLFPNGLAGLGAKPQTQLDALAQDGLLDLNPLAPLRRVMEIDGEHGALLTSDASLQVLALTGNCRPSTPAPVEEPVAVEPVPSRPRIPATKTTTATSPPTAPPPQRRRSAATDSAAARALVERIRARDDTLAGDLSRTDGWLCVSGETVRAWAQAHGVQAYALIRSLGHLSGCRVTPDGGLAVAEEP